MPAMPQKRKTDLRRKKNQNFLAKIKQANDSSYQHGMNIIGAEDGNMFCAFKKYGRYSAGTTFDGKKTSLSLECIKKYI